MTILTVGPHSSFPTIAAAMNAAAPADTIQLEAGYSNETATVTHNGMTISGDATSTGIVLHLGIGIPTFFLAGAAPINVFAAADGNGIVGNSGDNVITVTAGADAVNGGLGTDRLVVDYHLAAGAITGNSTSNFSEAGGGSRTVTITDGTFENFTVLTGSSADTLTVGDGNNIINAGDGANTVTAGNGPNNITGGSGADTITAGNGNNIIVAGDGVNTITAGNGKNTITGGSDADTITAGDGGNHIDGGNGPNKITSGSGNDVIIVGNIGSNTIVTGAGADTITVRGGAANVDSGAGNDRLVINYSAFTVDVTGGVTSGNLLSGYSGHIADSTGLNMVDYVSTENFSITTGSGNDVIATGDGADILNGGGGTNRLYGLGGNDTFAGGTATVGQNQLWGGSGTDTVDYSAQSGAAYVDLEAQAGYVNRGSGLVLTDQMNSIENVIGGSGNDTLVGDAGVNRLNASGGTNVLYGLGGDDTFVGATATSGQNQLWGGSGSDTADYSAQTASVYVDLGAQAGYVNHGSGLVLTDQMNSVENVIGGKGNDTLVGDAGNNVLQGGSGADALHGNGGADTFVYKSAADSNLTTGYDTIADFQTGIDTLDLSALHTSASHVLIQTAGSSSVLYADTNLATPGYELAIGFSGANAIAVGDIKFS